MKNKLANCLIGITIAAAVIGGVALIAVGILMALVFPLPAFVLYILYSLIKKRP